MPSRSLILAFASSAKRWHDSPAGRHPWRMAAVRRSGHGFTSNKLVSPPGLTVVALFPSFLCRRGAGEGAEGLQLRVAIWRGVSLIQSSKQRMRCSNLWSSSPAASCAEISAQPRYSLAERRPVRARASADRSIWRRLLSYLQAMVPKGRQGFFGRALASTFTAEIRYRWRGAGVEPSGVVPGFNLLVSWLKMRRGRRATLRSSFTLRGPVCKTVGPCCTFAFFLGPAACCTMDKINI